MRVYAQTVAASGVTRGRVAISGRGRGLIVLQGYSTAGVISLQVDGVNSSEVVVPLCRFPFKWDRELILIGLTSPNAIVVVAEDDAELALLPETFEHGNDLPSIEAGGTQVLNATKGVAVTTIAVPAGWDCTKGVDVDVVISTDDPAGIEALISTTGQPDYVCWIPTYATVRLSFRGRPITHGTTLTLGVQNTQSVGSHVSMRVALRPSR